MLTNCCIYKVFKTVSLCIKMSKKVYYPEK